jgi:hypothetical protein
MGQRSRGSRFEASPRQIVHEPLSGKKPTTKKGWRSGSSGRMPACLASMRPWIRTLVPQKKKNYYFLRGPRTLSPICPFLFPSELVLWCVFGFWGLALWELTQLTFSKCCLLPCNRVLLFLWGGVGICPWAFDFLSGSEAAWSDFRMFGVRKQPSDFMPWWTSGETGSGQVFPLSLLGGAKGGVRSGVLLRWIVLQRLSHFSFSHHMEGMGNWIQANSEVDGDGGVLSPSLALPAEGWVCHRSTLWDHGCPRAKLLCIEEGGSEYSMGFLSGAARDDLRMLLCTLEEALL